MPPWQAKPVWSGVWRVPDAPGFFTPKPDPAKHVWYARDLAGIAAADGVKLAAPVVIEADATPNPGGWPKGGQTVVDFPNNHLSYAMTWFGLAAGLIGVYFAYHISKGRLSLYLKEAMTVMDFISTRGQAPKANFADVLLAGLAPDGGLYLPACLAAVDRKPKSPPSRASPISRWRLKFSDALPAMPSAPKI